MKRKQLAAVSAALLASALLLQGCGPSTISNKTPDAPQQTAAKPAAPATAESASAGAQIAGLPENAKLIAKTTSVYRIQFDSPALGKEVRFNLYLPPGYDATKHYPTLYMLHPLNGSENSVLSSTGLSAAADKLIGEGKIQPLLIIAPLLESSYGLNLTEEDAKTCSSCTIGNYEDYLIKDLIPYVDSHFGTIANKSGRYIGGFSGGGIAALHAAFTHTDLFSKAGGHSASLYLDAWPDLYSTPELRSQRDPLALAANASLTELSVYLDCGDQDPYRFYEGAEKLYELLQKKQVKSEYHHGPGAHDEAYWDPNSENYLMFYTGITS
ncbi:putative esterase [Paenibacillus curdlanolyticus YK9]|uniref:Putative esterase n=1 Tax=Paenibacillus curdlanolyticus YK9 TaxID=717606 RepID=E0I7R5_9BACL|nr:alpha/beta hydrolase-fold protein [Paenibacillus curdlanolyticus]EFM11220.1 putative esterase [Paenibacillus curdlanolyticus YK9]